MLPTTSFVPPQFSEGMRQHEKSYSESRQSNYKVEQNDQLYTDDGNGYEPRRNTQYYNAPNERTDKLRFSDTPCGENEESYHAEQTDRRPEQYQQKQPYVRQDEYSHDTQINRQNNPQEREYIVRQNRQPQIIQENRLNKSENSDQGEDLGRFYSKNSVSIGGSDDPPQQGEGSGRYCARIRQYDYSGSEKPYVPVQNEQNDNQRYYQERSVSTMSRRNDEYSYDVNNAGFGPSTDYAGQRVSYSGHRQENVNTDNRGECGIRIVSEHRGVPPETLCHGDVLENAKWSNRVLDRQERYQPYQNQPQNHFRLDSSHEYTNSRPGENWHYSTGTAEGRKTAFDDERDYNDNRGLSPTDNFTTYNMDSQQFFDDRGFFVDSWTYSECRPERPEGTNQTEQQSQRARSYLTIQNNQQPMLRPTEQAVRSNRTDLRYEQEEQNNNQRKPIHTEGMQRQNIQNAYNQAYQTLGNHGQEQNQGFYSDDKDGRDDRIAPKYVETIFTEIRTYNNTQQPCKRCIVL